LQREVPNTPHPTMATSYAPVVDADAVVGVLDTAKADVGDSRQSSANSAIMVDICCMWVWMRMLLLLWMVWLCYDTLLQL
jgi:hypothetical protein